MSQANTTNPTELDDLLRGRIHLSGNGIGDGSVLQGKTVTRMVLSDGLSAEILRNVATLTSSGAGSGLDVPRLANTLVVNPCTIAGNPTRDGTLQLPFNSPADAIAYALANGMQRPIIALAPGNYSGNLTVPEQVRGVCFVPLVPSVHTYNPANITGNVSLVAYSGSSFIALLGVSISGDISCATAGAVPSHLVLVAQDSALSGGIYGSAVTIQAENCNVTGGPITASSGAVNLQLDRHSRNLIGDITITPTPTITLFDGPLTVAQGGDPGGSWDGTLDTDTIKQVKNYPDGRRVWQYTRLYSLVLENGVDNTTIQIDEEDHGGEDLPYTGNWPVVLVRIELWGSLPDPLSADPGGFFRHTFEGAIDKNGNDGVGQWNIREPMSQVPVNWKTNLDRGAVTTPTLVLSGTRNRVLGFSFRFGGPRELPSSVFARVTLSGTGRFAI